MIRQQGHPGWAGSQSPKKGKNDQKSNQRHFQKLMERNNLKRRNLFDCPMVSLNHKHMWAHTHTLSLTHSLYISLLQQITHFLSAYLVTHSHTLTWHTQTLELPFEVSYPFSSKWSSLCFYLSKCHVYLLIDSRPIISSLLCLLGAKVLLILLMSELCHWWSNKTLKDDSCSTLLKANVGWSIWTLQGHQLFSPLIDVMSLMIPIKSSNGCYECFSGFMNQNLRWKSHNSMDF